MLRPNGCMDQDATCYGVALGTGALCYRGTPLSSPKREWSPKFSAHVYCGRTAGWIKMVLGTEVGLSPGDFVLDGGPALLAKKGRSPRPNFYCGQTAACIKIPLGIELGLGPGDFLQRAQLHCKRCISYNNSVRLSVCPSVCLSVRLSHAGIVSKRRHVARCSFHCWIAKCV